MSTTITFRPGRELATKLPKHGASEVIREALRFYFASKRKRSVKHAFRTYLTGAVDHYRIGGDVVATKDGKKWLR